MADDKSISKTIAGTTYKYDKKRDIITTADSSSSRYLERTSAIIPVDLCIETTTNCNLSCKNCFSCSTPQCVGKNLNFKTAQSIINSKSRQLIRVSISGGEPFLHPQILTYLSLPEQFPDMGFIMNTNGVALDNIAFQHLRNWTCAISLHGNKKTNDVYTGSNSFRKTKKTILKSAALTNTHIYSVLSSYTNQHDIDWLMRFRESSGATYLRFIVPRLFGRVSSIPSNKIIQYAKSVVSENYCGLKVSRSNTYFLAVNGSIRLSN